MLRRVAATCVHLRTSVAESKTAENPKKTHLCNTSAYYRGVIGPYNGRFRDARRTPPPGKDLAPRSIVTLDGVAPPADFCAVFKVAALVTQDVNVFLNVGWTNNRYRQRHDLNGDN